MKQTSKRKWNKAINCKAEAFSPVLFLLHHCILLHHACSNLCTTCVSHYKSYWHHTRPSWLAICYHTCTCAHFCRVSSYPQLCICLCAHEHSNVQYFKCVCMDRPPCSFETASQFYLQPQSRPPGHRTASQRPCFGMCWKTSALSLSSLSLTQNLATPSQCHPVHSRAHGSPFYMTATSIHFRWTLCLNSQFLLIGLFKMQPKYRQIPKAAQMQHVNRSVTITLECYGL